MTPSTPTPLQSKFGPIVADGAGTITVQEASDVLDCSRLRVCALLNVTAGRVLVTDVLALKSFVPPSSLEAAPDAKLAANKRADDARGGGGSAYLVEGGLDQEHSRA